MKEYIQNLKVTRKVDIKNRLQIIIFPKDTFEDKAQKIKIIKQKLRIKKFIKVILK